MLRKPILGLLLIVLLQCIGPRAEALRFGPLSQEFSGQGPGAKRTYRVTNDGDETIAVQVQMKHRAVAADGTETLTDAEDLFAVFPPQMVLLPGDARVIRVQWLGDPAPEQQLAFRIIIEQLPVTFEDQPKANTVVRLLLRYEGSVYISPEGAKSRIVVSAAPGKGEGGETALSLVFANAGTSYRIMKELELSLRSRLDSSTATLKPEALKGVNGQNVLAGRERHFTIPWPEGLAVGPLDVSATMAPAR